MLKAGGYFKGGVQGPKTQVHDQDSEAFTQGSSLASKVGKRRSSCVQVGPHEADQEHLESAATSIELWSWAGKFIRRSSRSSGAYASVTSSSGSGATVHACTSDIDQACGGHASNRALGGTVTDHSGGHVTNHSSAVHARYSSGTSGKACRV